MRQNHETGTQQSTTFDKLYRNLATTWDQHEQRRLAGAPIVALAESSIHLHHDRAQIWDWWKENRKGRNR
ncbi:MAG: hypothetical protein OEM39_08230 [Acidimicrobiia bacterium]|nr:hypothetical protein [Acidimicrobiia bacterium]MDH3463449.1 hypothetical protein [Acidimicrobiia bacterium]